MPNTAHDARGRFTSGGGTGLLTPGRADRFGAIKRAAGHHVRPSKIASATLSDTVDAGRHYTHPEYQKAKRALALARNAAENHAKWRAAHAPDESHAYHRAALRAYAAQDRALDRGISRGGRTLEATIAHAKKGRS